jgi:penicillin-binding protein 1B
LKRPEEEAKLQGAVIVMQPRTGTSCHGGGTDYAASQFNRITQARRQPGSAFKPFVYLAGLDRFTPSYRLSNEPRSYELDGVTWQPRNVHPVVENGLTLRRALAGSDNLATVDLAVQTGLLTVMNTAMAFRFSTPMKPWPSLALGAFEVILSKWPVPSAPSPPRAWSPTRFPCVPWWMKKGVSWRSGT